MSNWLRKLPGITLSLALLTMHCVSLSASSISLVDPQENHIQDSFSISHREVDAVQLQDTCSSASSTLQALFAGFKSLVTSIDNNRCKALVALLAMQGGTSFSSLPMVEGLDVTDIDQVGTYVIDGPPVQLQQIYIKDCDLCNATIVLADINAGTVMSRGTELTQTFSEGTWNAYGDLIKLSSLLDLLFFTPSRGYNTTIILYPTIDNSRDEFRSRARYQGTIQLNPLSSSPLSSTPSTTINTFPLVSSIASSTTIDRFVSSISSSTTTAAIVTNAPVTPSPMAQTTSTTKPLPTIQTSMPSVVSKVDSTMTTVNPSGKSEASIALDGQPSNSFTTFRGDLSGSSSSEQGITDSILIPDRTSLPLNASPYDPTAAIAGGVVGAVVLSCGLVGGFLVYKKGALCFKKAQVDPLVAGELGVRPDEAQKKLNKPGPYQQVPAQQRSNQYDKVTPGELNPALSSGYDVVPQVLIKNEYESCDQPL